MLYCNKRVCVQLPKQTILPQFCTSPENILNPKDVSFSFAVEFLRNNNKAKTFIYYSFLHKTLRTTRATRATRA